VEIFSLLNPYFKDNLELIGGFVQTFHFISLNRHWLWKVHGEALQGMSRFNPISKYSHLLHLNINW